MFLQFLLTSENIALAETTITTHQAATVTMSKVTHAKKRKAELAQFHAEHWVLLPLSDLFFHNLIRTLKYFGGSCWSTKTLSDQM